MGMYTGLRMQGIIKEEFREMIDLLLNHDWTWSDFFYRPEFDYGFLASFIKLPRNNMIPFGSLSYMPDEWEVLKDNHEDFQHSWEKRKDHPDFERHFDKETGYFQFQCSLKNYDSEIQCFLNTVVPVIFESTTHIEEYYEEWNSSNMYQLVNIGDLTDGILVQLDKGIVYKPEDDPYDFWQ